MENNNFEMTTQEQNITTDIMQSSEAIFCSLDNSTREGAIKMYNALNTPAGRVGELIGKTLLVSDVIAEPITLTNEDGTVSDTVRVALITPEGKAYTAISVGIYNAVKKLIAVFGLPTWSDPLPLEVKQITRKSKEGQPRNVLTLVLKA